VQFCGLTSSLTMIELNVAAVRRVFAGAVTQDIELNLFAHKNAIIQLIRSVNDMITLLCKL